MKIKISVLTLSFLLGSSIVFGQNLKLPCGFDSFTNNKSILNAEKIIQSGVKNILANKAMVSSDTIKTIPMVFHIIHNGSFENISEAQVQSQIVVLNEDYGKYPGSNGDGNGVDTRVRFCLAKIDPNGNCTNGIVRIKTPLTNHPTYQRSLLKELSFWDNTRYLNVYVVRTISGNVGGYSSFPGGPADEDGIVVRHNLVGKIGTATGLGRTVTHEVGHWLGLYHVFNNGCGVDTCSDGDYVCDTPPASVPHYTCSAVNTCSNDFPDVNDQVRNYMDYTPDACQNMLTNGQKLRAQASLDSIRTLIWTPANLISTGCDSNYSPPPSCPIVADFVTLTPEICDGNSIYFMDRSLNDPDTWQWSFPGGTPSSSNLQNPTISYASPGSFPVTLIVSDSLDTDTITIPSYIIVSLPGVGDSLSYAENFEAGLYPPTGITINNFDGGITWELDSLGSTSGKFSLRINNLININYGSIDEIVLPFFDLSSASQDSTIVMTFNWAYAKSDPTFSDELLVSLSTDCGTNFTTIFYRTQGLLATGPTQTTPFVPDSSQWKNAIIDLTPYRNESYVQIKLVNVTDGGNNLYVDDLFVGSGSYISGLNKKNSILNDVSIFPNPSFGTSTLKYTLEKAGPVEIVLYDLQGQILKSFDEEWNNSGAQEFSFSTEGWNPGTYFLKVKTEEGEKAIKFLIAR
jgi:PKD repeat protein